MFDNLKTSDREEIKTIDQLKLNTDVTLAYLRKKIQEKLNTKRPTLSSKSQKRRNKSANSLRKPRVNLSFAKNIKSTMPPNMGFTLNPPSRKKKVKKGTKVGLTYCGSQNYVNIQNLPQSTPKNHAALSNDLDLTQSVSENKKFEIASDVWRNPTTSLNPRAATLDSSHYQPGKYLTLGQPEFSNPLHNNRSVRNKPLPNPYLDKNL